MRLSARLSARWMGWLAGAEGLAGERRAAARNAAGGVAASGAAAGGTTPRNAAGGVAAGGTTARNAAGGVAASGTTARNAAGGAWAALARAAALGVVLCGAWSALSAQAQQVTSGQIYIPGPGDRAGEDAATMTAMIQKPADSYSGAIEGARGAAGAPVAPSRADAQTVPAGMISIPGPGERGAANAAADAAGPQVITIPGPGERGAQVVNGTPTRAAATGGTATGGTATSGMATGGMPTSRMPAVSAHVAQPASAVAPAPAHVAQPASAPLTRVNVASAESRVAPVVVGAQAASRSATAATPGNRLATGVAQAARNGNANAAGALPANAAPSSANARTAIATAPAPAAAAAYAQTAAQTVPPGQQDGETIRATALAYLQQQSAGLPGRVSITVSPVFPRGLAACTSLEPFIPPGARMWGHTTVGIHCVGQRPWTLYVQARVSVAVTYYTAARPIGQGDTLAAADLQPRDGDLASLPRTVITDPSQAIGAVSLERIGAGLPLRTDMLRSASSVVIGQTVKLVANGPDFTISTEGSVLNNAAPGQRVQVRTGNGQIVSGVVKDAGTVEVQI